jgi:beta-RFAP synthase
MPITHGQSVITVDAPARLHLGFVDLNGSLGRRFGSVGLTLEGIAAQVTAHRAQDWGAGGMQRERAAACLDAMRRTYGLEQPVRVQVEGAIPAHAGLGSGTQLALAVGAAVSALCELNATPREIARVLARGARSGIGIGAFEQGGFLVDGGRGEEPAPPPLISRIAVPGAWRVILILDHGVRGLHGPQETAAFQALPAFPEETAARLCRLLLMRALPALCEADIEAFGAAICELQAHIGDHFAPAQGGRYASARVAAVLEHLREHGARCLGQSSWGPTGFAIVESESRAEALARVARERFGHETEMEFLVLRARNRGAQIARTAAPAAAATAPAAPTLR